MEKEVREKVLMYRILEARYNSLIKQRELILQKILEISKTISSIKELEKSDEVLFSLGGEAYTIGKVTNKQKFLVEVGAGIVLEKNKEESINILSKRKNELEKGLKEIESELQKISQSLQTLARELQKSLGT